MKKSLTLLFVLALLLTGCFGSEKSEENKEITVMKKAEVKNGNTVLFSCNYSYNKEGNRTGAEIVERNSSSVIYRTVEYNLDNNITKLVKKRENIEGNVLSNDTFTYEYGYSTGRLIINKNGTKNMR